MITWSQVKAIAYLRSARSLIEDQEHWTSGCQAQDHRGVAVPPTSPEAVAWCAVGAIIRVTHSHRESGHHVYGLYQALELALPYEYTPPCGKDDPPVEYVNDHDAITHQDVLDIYDRAIDLVKAGKVSVVCDE